MSDVIAREVPCSICERAFVKLRRDSRVCTDPECQKTQRRAWAARDRAKRRDAILAAKRRYYRAEPTSTVGSAVTCPVCSGSFAKGHGGAVYCSDGCRASAVAERKRAARQSSPEAARAAQRRWREDNGQYARALYAKGRYRIRARAMGVEHAPYSPEQLVALLDDGCHICGVQDDLPHAGPLGGALGWDHVIAMANGGPDRIENIRAAHQACNSGKRAS